MNKSIYEKMSKKQKEEIVRKAIRQANKQQKELVEEIEK